MKLFKCYVKETSVREGFLFVEAKSTQQAESLDWLEWAMDEMDYYELPNTEVRRAIESAEEVKSPSQVPKSQLKEYPWYIPNDYHDEERTIEDWVKSMTPVDISEMVEWRIELRMRELKRIKDELKTLNRLAKKKAK